MGMNGAVRFFCRVLGSIYGVISVSFLFLMISSIPPVLGSDKDFMSFGGFDGWDSVPNFGRQAIAVNPFTKIPNEKEQQELASEAGDGVGNTVSWDTLAELGSSYSSAWSVSQMLQRASMVSVRSGPGRSSESQYFAVQAPSLTKAVTEVTRHTVRVQKKGMKPAQVNQGLLDLGFGMQELKSEQLYRAAILSDTACPKSSALHKSESVSMDSGLSSITASLSSLHVSEPSGSEDRLPDELDDMLTTLKANLEPGMAARPLSGIGEDVELLHSMQANSQLMTCDSGCDSYFPEPFSALQKIRKPTNFEDIQLILNTRAAGMGTGIEPQPSGLTALLAFLAEQKRPLIILEKETAESKKYGRVLYFDGQTMQWSFQRAAQKIISAQVNDTKKPPPPPVILLHDQKTWLALNWQGSGPLTGTTLQTIIDKYVVMERLENHMLESGTFMLALSGSGGARLVPVSQTSTEHTLKLLRYYLLAVSVGYPAKESDEGETPTDTQEELVYGIGPAVPRSRYRHEVINAETDLAKRQPEVYRAIHLIRSLRASTEGNIQEARKTLPFGLEDELAERIASIVTAPLQEKSDAIKELSHKWPDISRGLVGSSANNVLMQEISTFLDSRNIRMLVPSYASWRDILICLDMLTEAWDGEEYAIEAVDADHIDLQPYFSSEVTHVLTVLKNRLNKLDRGDGDAQLTREKILFTLTDESHSTSDRLNSMLVRFIRELPWQNFHELPLPVRQFAAWARDQLKPFYSELSVRDRLSNTNLRLAFSMLAPLNVDVSQLFNWEVEVMAMRLFGEGEFRHLSDSVHKILTGREAALAVEDEPGQLEGVPRASNLQNGVQLESEEILAVQQYGNKDVSSEMRRDYTLTPLEQDRANQQLTVAGREDGVLVLHINGSEFELNSVQLQLFLKGQDIKDITFAPNDLRNPHFRRHLEFRMNAIREEYDDNARLQQAMAGLTQREISRLVLSGELSRVELMDEPTRLFHQNLLALEQQGLNVEFRARLKFLEDMNSQRPPMLMIENKSAW